MDHNAEGVKEYFKFVDLRSKVVDGDATATERDHYFEQLEQVCHNMLMHCARVGMEYGVCVSEEPGTDLAVAMEMLFAVGAGRPGPMVSHMMQEVEFSG